MIVRLPALFGYNLKKNFIYDYLNFIPSKLSEKKYNELAAKNHIIKDAYEYEGDGFYKYKSSRGDRDKIKNAFIEVGFSAMNFTDSRAEYQFYPLDRLWRDIEIAMKQNLSIVNLAVQPICVGDLVYNLEKKHFVNELDSDVLRFDFKTEYAELFGGQRGYILNKEQVLEKLKEFIACY